MQDLNPTAAGLGTLQELLGADLSTGAVPSREHKPHISLLYPMAARKPWAPLRALTLTRQHLSQLAEFHQGIIHPPAPTTTQGVHST